MCSGHFWVQENFQGLSQAALNSHWGSILCTWAPAFQWNAMLSLYSQTEGLAVMHQVFVCNIQKSPNFWLKFPYGCVSLCLCCPLTSLPPSAPVKKGQSDLALRYSQSSISVLSIIQGPLLHRPRKQSP